MSKNNTKKKYNIIIIVMLMIIIGVSIILKNKVYDTNIKQTMVDIPRVSAQLYSSSNGSKHVLFADLSLDISKQNKEEVNVEQIQYTIQEILKDVDYDIIKKQESLSYIRELLKEELSQKYTSITINNVYANNLVTDFKIEELKTSNKK